VVHPRISKLSQYRARSLVESVSGIHAYRETRQITTEDFKILNELAFKLENGLLQLVESLERKQSTGEWIDHLIVKDSNEVYERME